MAIRCIEESPLPPYSFFSFYFLVFFWYRRRLTRTGIMRYVHHGRECRNRLVFILMYVRFFYFRAEWEIGFYSASWFFAGKSEKGPLFGNVCVCCFVLLKIVSNVFDSDRKSSVRYTIYFGNRRSSMCRMLTSRETKSVRFWIGRFDNFKMRIKIHFENEQK